MSIILALDFGGTKHTAAVVHQTPANREKPAWSAHERTYSSTGVDAMTDIRQMVHLARQVLAGTTPDAVGVSFGGPVDAERGVVRLSHHVPGWENVPLADILRGEFSAPVVVDNDANAGALGEHRYGAGQGYSSLLYITVSTGVGGGWILNGIPWRGAENMAGEIGHTVVDPAGPSCLCGKRGCLESLASGPYMVERARKLLEEDPGAGELLRGLFGGNLEALTTRHLSEAAHSGDPFARQVLADGASALGTGIGNAANLINPELFVLGGGVTKSGDFWWGQVRSNARKTTLPEIHFDIEPALLGDDAPLWGAVVLALDSFSKEG